MASNVNLHPYSKAALLEQKAKEAADATAGAAKDDLPPVYSFLDKDWKDSFIAIGIGTDVPKLLRHQGKVRNRHMSKRDTERLVKEVWAEKTGATAETDVDQSLPLDEFTYQYLKKKLGVQSTTVGMGNRL